MPLRLAKIVMVAAIALFASIVTFGNLTDYHTNYLFVQHVLSMDTIFPFSDIRYRAITDPEMHRVAYAVIIATEGAIAVLCWLGAFNLLRYVRGDAAAFNSAKMLAVAGLTLGFHIPFAGTAAAQGMAPEINAWVVVLVRKQNSAVNDEQTTAVLEHRHISAHFAETTKGGDSQSAWCERLCP